MLDKNISEGLVLIRVPNGFEIEFNRIFNSLVDDFIELQCKNPNLEIECKKIRSDVTEIKGWRVNKKNGEITKVK
jgi:hypothetical protein